MKAAERPAESVGEEPMAAAESDEGRESGDRGYGGALVDDDEGGGGERAAWADSGEEGEGGVAGSGREAGIASDSGDVDERRRRRGRCRPR